jgi:PleD family two-component response regulator
MNNHQTSSIKGNILIVDDNPANLDLLSGILSEQGYKVRLIPDGQLALMSVKSTLPDLILLDILMPEMDGYQVCEKLKADERTKDIPVIFVSAVHEVFDKVKAFSLGGVDYITKPFEAKEVLARIETQLRISRLSKQLLEQNAQLTVQKELLQTIFDHIPVMVTLYDAFLTQSIARLLWNICLPLLGNGKTSKPGFAMGVIWIHLGQIFGFLMV